MVKQIQGTRTAVVQGPLTTKTLPTPTRFITQTIKVPVTEYRSSPRVTSVKTKRSTISTTILFLKTNTVTSTTTSTLTSFSTVTSYAACATTNQLVSYNGNSINNVFPSNNTYYYELDDDRAASAERCCSQCQESYGSTQGCRGYQWRLGRCVILYIDGLPDVCMADSMAGYFIASAQSPAYTLGNGPCGYIYAGP